MKIRILLLMVIGLSVHSFAQNSLKQLISGKQGISNHYVILKASETPSFSGPNLRQVLDLDARSDLVLIKSFTDPLGIKHYRFYQTWQNIPVDRSMYTVHTKNGKISGLSGEIITDFPDAAAKLNSPALSKKQAIESALKVVSAQEYMWQNQQREQDLKEQMRNDKATYYPDPVLVWFSKSESINPRSMQLAYKVDIYASQPVSRAYYFIDAQSGQLLGTEDLIHTSDAVGTGNTLYSGTQTIHSDYYNGSYRLRDYTRGNGVITKKGNVSGKPDYTNSSSNWNLSGQDKNAMDVHWGVEMTYDYYKVSFNRNSIDNNGYALTSYVNLTGLTDNAYWDGSTMNYGKRSGSTNGVTGIDVTGHELTHGVTQNTCNLTYSYESGAMNESLSDIMGKSVQFFAKPSDINWQLSNDMNWIIRDMSNPNFVYQPDTYKGTYWYSGASDNGGVHTNSGVGNFMFYLLSTGGSGTNDIGNAYTVSGIGLAKAQQIIYRTQTVYLFSSAKYADWRTACINAATDLYGAGSNEVIQVQNAWYAVGIGAAGGGGTPCDIPSGLAATSITSSSANLSWTSTGASSYNLQYKITGGATWTTISGISSNSYALSGLNAGTSYQWQVQSVCSGGATSAYSATASFTTNGGGGVTYCTTQGNTSYEFINKVTFGSINNTSGDNNGYGNFTGFSTNVNAGSSYTISLTPGFYGFSYNEYWTVYIDFNQNGSFTDAGEMFKIGSSSGTKSKSIKIPTSAKNGATRMRVQMHYGSYLTNPCGNFTDGEAEDYTINISGGTGYSFAANESGQSAKLVGDNGFKIEPNPVVSSTAKVSYSLAKDGNVVIKVIDLSGKPIQQTVLGQQQKGTYRQDLNQLDKLRSGTYLVMIEQDGQAIAKLKLLVVH